MVMVRVRVTHDYGYGYDYGYVIGYGYERGQGHSQGCGYGYICIYTYILTNFDHISFLVYKYIITLEISM